MSVVVCSYECVIQWEVMGSCNIMGSYRVVWVVMNL